ERMSLRHRVALVRHADFRQAVLLRVFERRADDPVHALVSVYLFLNGDLVRGAGFEATTDADVDAFRVLSKHDEVHVFRATAFQRTESIVDESDRPEINKEIQIEPRGEENVTSGAIIGDARIAERAEQNGVEAPQQVEPAGRHRDAGLEKVVRAPRQLLELERSSRSRRDGFENLDCFCCDFLADPVAGNDRYTH